MRYMINVDLETANVSGEGDCHSRLHEPFRRHYDLTVHELGARCRNRRSVEDRTTRYWDDNDGSGYGPEELVQRIHELRVQHQKAHPRRCLRCKVGAHLPDWD